MARAVWLAGLAAAVCGLLLPGDLLAQSRPPIASLADMTIEELLNVRVTTVSKRDQHLRDTATAISVLSNDDLHRAAATTLPEALRLVAGMNVGVVNAREWAVSARGFNFVFASKLLVLVDGRAVYTPLLSGVNWDLQQVLFEDVDRVEVIRGPGAAIWGANAVNGVVNVVTRSSEFTQGGFLSVGGGDVLTGTVAARYGGRIAPGTTYRAFGSMQSQDGYTLVSGAPANDAWSKRHGGVRFDRSSADGRTQATWQADASGIRTDARDYDAHNINTLGRWTRRSSVRSRMEVQGYYDRVLSNQANRNRSTSDTFDLSVQQTAGVGSSHDVIWGLGYRFMKNRFYQTTPSVPIRNPRVNLQLLSAFVHDEFTLVPDTVTATAGVKLEHNGFTGYEIQPTVRAIWKVSARQVVWSALSRAVRTPNAIQDKDINGIVVGPPFAGPGGGLYLPTITGNGEPVSEVLVAVEAGYRLQASSRISLDLAAFRNEYTGLITSGGVETFVPGIPVGAAEIPFKNLLDSTTTGVELTATSAPTTASRVIVAFAVVSQDLRGPAIADRTVIGSPPRSQVSLRAGHDIRRNLSVDGQLRYVGAFTGVADYLTADIQMLFRPTSQFEFGLVTQDLFDRAHLEQPPAPVTVTAMALRKVYAKLTWRFGPER